MSNLCRSGKSVGFQATGESSSKEDVDYQPVEKKRRGRPPREEKKVEEEVCLFLALEEHYALFIAHMLCKRPSSLFCFEEPGRFPSVLCIGLDWSCAVLEDTYF